MAEETVTEPDIQSIPVRLSELEINEGAWPCPADKLERHKEIENLSPVLLNAEAPLVFALDAPWGGGKTTFIRLWQSYLARESKACLYLNAWESDFSEDPLLPLLAEFDDLLVDEDDESTAKKAMNKAKKYAPGLLKSTALAATKAATFGALDLDKEYEKLIADVAEDLTGNLVDSFKVQKATLTKFKELVAESLDVLPEGQQNLIIFVDELDRCRPTYAIELLERIKHLFDVERIVFVLAVNRDQLSKSLQGVYGTNFDGMQYLKRFIDLDYQLRVPNLTEYVDAKFELKDIRASFTRISARHGADHRITVRDITSMLAARFSYQPRDVDQLIARLRLITRSIQTNYEIEPVALVCMLFLREQNSELYERIRNDKNSINDVVLFFAGGNIAEVALPKRFGNIMGWLIHTCARDFSGSVSVEVRDYWSQLHESLSDDMPQKTEVAAILIAMKGPDDMWGQDEVRETAFKRIELVSQIDVS